MPRLGAVTSIRMRLGLTGAWTAGTKRRVFRLNSSALDGKNRPSSIDGYLGTPTVASHRTRASVAVSAGLNKIIKQASDAGVAGLRKVHWAGGHLLGDQFGGPDEDKNLVPVPRAFNIGTY